MVTQFLNKLKDSGFLYEDYPIGVQTFRCKQGIATAAFST